MHQHVWYFGPSLKAYGHVPWALWALWASQAYGPMAQAIIKLIHTARWALSITGYGHNVMDSVGLILWNGPMARWASH